jgi:lipopolysaccharide transport system permease protein
MSSFNYLKIELVSTRKLIKAILFLSKTSFRSQHSANRLGPLWITIHSLVFLVFLTMLRHLFFGINNPAIDIARIYVAYSIFGVLTHPLRDGGNYLLRNRVYFEGTNLPVSLFLVKSLIDTFRSLSFSWVLVPIVILWSGLSLNPREFPILFVWLFSYIVLYVGIANWLAPLILRFPDIEQIIQAVITAGLFMTPIWWKIENLNSDFAQNLCSINPFYWGIQSIQNVFLGGSIDSDNLKKFMAFAGLNFLVGTSVFLLVKRKFIYWYYS